MPRRLFILLPLVCMLIACQPVRDAQQTVAMADSLRVNEGITCDDSLALAEAYSTLGHWRLIYPDDYARSCYYYGRMLRNRNDQVSAMRAFISGTHAPYVQRFIPLPQFTDYHILGRIYSNMGTMCHLAKEFELSYDMYEYASESILQTSDSTSYYYLLNDMAYELAEQKLLNESCALLSRIDQECTDSDVRSKVWETKARLYYNIASYDSAIYAAKELYTCGYFATSGYVTLAQAFWSLQQYDSALYYANIVMSMPCASEQEKFNMLYILAYNDSSTCKEESQKRSETREDIDKMILDPLHEQLTLAVDLLRQDRHSKPHYFIIVTIISFALLFFVWGILFKHYKVRIAHIRRKEEELYRSTQELNAERNVHKETLINELENICKSLNVDDNLSKTLHIKNYDSMKKFVNKKLNMFVDKLEAKNVLSNREIQFCVLVLLNVKQSTIAEVLVYSDKSIKKTKDLIAKKLCVTSASLRNYLIDLAIS